MFESLRTVLFFSYSNGTSFFLKSRFETVDMAVRLLIPIIVLQNHNRYNILHEGHNYSIDVQAIEREVSYFSCMSFYVSEATKFVVPLPVCMFIHLVVRTSECLF